MNRQKKLTVLIVEDEHSLAEHLERRITAISSRFQVLAIAANGSEGLQLLAQGHPDIVFCDIRMPVMDGLEATRVIRSMEREDCHTLPIIAMSANAFDDDLKKSVACGMNGHLSKPVEVEKLYHILDQVLRQR